MSDGGTTETVENQFEVDAELIIAMGDELRKTDKTVTELVSECCVSELREGSGGV